MNEQDADKLLRDLFRQSGPIQAPEGLDARILQRIAVLPHPALVPDKALLPKWTWAVGAALAIGLVLFPGISTPTSWPGHIPTINWDKVLGSPWLMMGVGACVALLGLDTWLNKRRLVHQPN